MIANFFRSDNACSQIDYILVRKSDFKSVRDVKVIVGECVSQHKMLAGDIELNTSFSKSRCTPTKRKLWKLSNPEVRLEYGNCVHESAQSFLNPQNSDIAWTEIKTCLLNACDTACDWTRGGKPKRKETWWNDEVDSTIKEKIRLWKDWQKGGDKEKYLQAKRKAKSAVYAARKRAQEDKFGDLKSDDQRNQIFKEARRMTNENQDIVGEKCIKDDDGNLAFDDKSKLAAWKCQYEKLLNVEFPWDNNTLSEEQPFQVPPVRITTEMVSESLSNMKKGKATAPSGLNVEMILKAGDDTILAITHLINCIIAENKIPDDWCLSYIINCYKGKGDALLRGNYRGLKLLDQVMKVMEHILATIMRTQIDIDAM